MRRAPYRRPRPADQAGTAAKVLAGTSLAIAGLDFARRFVRRQKLFCPAPDPLVSWNPADYGLDPAMVEELWFESDDGRLLYGWYCRTENPIASGVYFHGNSGNLSYSAAVIPRVLESGINTLLFDYRGFGRSEGYPTPSGVLVDALAAARKHEELRPRDLPAIAYGFSLGGPIAANTAVNFPFDGLILQSTFTNLREITRFAFPRVPLHVLSGNPLDTAGCVASLKIPTMIVHGSNDEVCPAWMAERLYGACRDEHRELHVIPGGMHSNLYQMDADGMVALLRRFATDLASEEERIEHTHHAPDPSWHHRLFRYVRRTQRHTANA